MRRALKYGIAVIVTAAAIDALIIVICPLILRPRSSNVAVVLGNEVAPNGRPSARLKARLDRALSLYSDHLVSKILVSGGFEKRSGYDEATVMSEYLKANGIPVNALLCDSDGINTRSTAKNAKSLLPADQHVVVVSQWFHIARSVLAMRQCGFKNISAAYPRFFEPRDPFSFGREMVALPVYAINPACEQSNEKK